MSGGRFWSRGGREEFVTFDTCRYTAAAVVRLNAQHTRVEADGYVTGKRDLLRQRQDKLNRAAGIGSSGFDQEIQAAKANVAGFPILLRNAITGCEPHLQGEHHRETSRGAPLDSFVHRSSRRLGHLRQN